MRVLRILAHGIFVLSVFVSAHAQSTNVLGQWDFNTNNLSAATTGSPLQFIGDLQGTFLTNQINELDAGVMRFPAATPQQSILATFSPVANGGGTNLNQYTVLMDIMWPPESEGLFRSLLNASTNNADDGAMFVNPDNQLGIFNDYAFDLAPNEWHRVVLVYDLTASNVVRYVDGVPSAPLALPDAGVDSRFSLNSAILFFSDNDGETAPGFVNSLQLRAGLMTATQVAALGKASSGGLGAPSDPDPEPVGDVTLTIERSSNNIIIRLSPVRNAQLQKKASLNDPQWQPGETSNSGTFTVPITDPSAFFRIEIK